MDKWTQKLCSSKVNGIYNCIDFNKKEYFQEPGGSPQIRQKFRIETGKRAILKQGL